MDWDSAEISGLIQRALSEDIGSGDITSQVLVPEARTARAVFLAKQAGVLAGLPLISRIFRTLESDCEIDEYRQDGETFRTGDTFCKLRGKAAALLAGERTALNFLQRLTGIATTTSELVRLAAPFGISILDTRKTTPLMRSLEKYAVRTGGGVNHRFGLFDGILVKDNHLQLEPNFEAVLAKFDARGFSPAQVEIEVTSLEMLQKAMRAGANWFLLDNMSPAMIRRCIELKKPGMKFEVSGGITEQNFGSFLISGVDAISLGSLTHSPKSADISMELQL
jgi:nicotinate-nucleotide pyrophosphorylase (carboxylating)